MIFEMLYFCVYCIVLIYLFIEYCWFFGLEYDVFKVDGCIFMIIMIICGWVLVNFKVELQKLLLNQ